MRSVSVKATTFSESYPKRRFLFGENHMCDSGFSEWEWVRDATLAPGEFREVWVEVIPRQLSW